MPIPEIKTLNDWWLTVEQVIKSRSVSSRAKETLNQFLDADCVDAWADLQMLEKIFRARLDVLSTIEK